MRLSKAIYTNEELTTELIGKLIGDNNTERLQLLQDYYEGKHKAIIERPTSNNRPNNILINGYPQYIVDMYTGYSTGNPISYLSSDSNYMEALQDVFDLNDEQDENSELAKECSVKGVGYELVYTDENADIRFDMLETESVITVYDTNISAEMRFAIRTYTVDETDYVEVYTDREIIRYEGSGSDLTETERYLHNLDEVPVIEFVNNSSMTGDFENVLSLIDAYDKVQSDSLNDTELFADAYLKIIGAMGTDEEDLKNMREQRAFILNEGGDVGYLTKDINDTALENIKKRLNDDIHKFSGIVDITDENTFGGNSSGIAFKYKLLALENKVANKERKFKKALQKRIRLITKYLNLKGGNYDFTDVNIRFARNLPEDESIEIDNAIKLLGLVSERTALSTLSMVDNVEKELEMKEKESKESYSDDLYNDNLEDEVTEESEEVGQVNNIEV